MQSHHHLSSRGCSRQILSRSPIGLIERCTCGAVHLSIGALSIRIELPVLHALSVMLREAITTIDAERSMPRPRARA